jgi:small conductance mechanosensitive channel
LLGTGIGLLIAVQVSLPTRAAESVTPEAAPSREEVEAVIATLEDPDARAELVAKLRVMAEAMQESPQERNEVVSVTADLLREVSVRMRDVAATLGQMTTIVQEVPVLLAWLQRNAQDPAVRSRWAAGAGQLAGLLAAAYLALWLVARLVSRPQRRLAEARPAGYLGRVWVLIGRLLLDLLPIVGFAAAGYLTLMALEPDSGVRIIALAWINATILVRAVLAVGAFVVAPGLPQLRLFDASDETAEYLQVWLRRLGTTLIYGFMALQAAVLLGVKAGIYHAGLGLLGLAGLAMLLILVLQNRQPIAELIQGDQSEAAARPVGMRMLRRRLGQVWHLLAAAYLIVAYGVWLLRVPDGFLFLLQGTVLSLGVIVLGRVALGLVATAFERGLRVSRDLQQRYPGLQARLNRYFPALHRLVNLAIYLLVGLYLLESWRIDAVSWVMEGPGQVLGGAFARILLILAGALLTWEVANSLIERMLAESTGGGTQTVSARAKTLLTVGRNALLVVIGVVGTLMVLSELGINIGPLLAGAGVLGLAIGFGAQRLVQDVITGVFILFQDLMSVGDVVKVGDKAGLVEALSIRSVRLRDLAGVVHTIPFSAIDSLSNLTKEYSCYVFDLGVAYREDVDEVIALLKSIGEEMQADAELGPLILEPIEVMGVDAFADSAVMIKGRLKTLPLKQWQVGRAFNRLVKKRFDAAGIEIPFPHRTLYFGEDKAGTAPAARLRVTREEGAPGQDQDSTEALASLHEPANPSIKGSLP